MARTCWSIRVDDRRFPTDFPPSGLSTTGVPTGGWWNYGGLLREVYLRKIDARRLQHRGGPARPAVRHLRCRTSPTRRRCATTATRRSGCGSPHAWARARSSLGTASVGAKKFATFTKRIAVKNPKTWSPTRPVPLQHVLDRQRRQEDAADLPRADGHPLDQGRRRPSDAQRQAAELPRLRHPRGLARQGLRDRRRPARAADPVGARGGRDALPQPLSAAPLLLRAPRRARHAGVDRGPGLLGQDQVPQAAQGPPAGGPGAGQRGADQHQPPVDHRVVGRQRAERAAGPGAGLLHPTRGQARQVAGPDAPRGPRGRGLPVGGLPAGVRAAGRPGHQRVLRVVLRPQRSDRRPDDAQRLPRQRPPVLPRTRRS